MLRQKPNVLLDFIDDTLHHALLLKEHVVQQCFNGMQATYCSSKFLDDGLLNCLFGIAEYKAVSPSHSSRRRNFRF